MDARGTTRCEAAAAALPESAEWWELLAERSRRRIAASRWAPVLRRLSRLATWGSLFYLLAILLFWPTGSWAVRVWFGVAWVLLAWVLMARTRTLRVTTAFRVFALAIPWSVAIGAISWWLTVSLAGLPSVSGVGGTVVVASIVEEVLKLAPLAAVALLAPGRARRFAVADWALAGFASGSAFELVEESVRRVHLMAGKHGILDICRYQSGYERLRCYDVPEFGVNPFGSGFAGDPPYAGHAVMTALVSVALGLAIRLVRGRLVGPVGRIVVWGLPAVVLAVVMVDHAGRNAGRSSGGWGSVQEAVPVGIRLFHTASGGGHGREALLFVLLCIGMVLDASAYRLGTMADVAPNAPAGALERGYGRVRGAVSGWSVPVHAQWLLASVLDLGYLVVRDLRDTVTVLLGGGQGAGDARSRRAQAAQTAREVQVLWEYQRAARAAVMRDLFDAGRAGRPRARLVVVALVTAGLVVVLVVTPWLARALEEAAGGGGFTWLAGVLEAIGDWWAELGVGWKMLAASAVVALAMLVPGVGLGTALAVGGTSWNMAARADDFADAVRDPRGAALRYLRDRGPVGVAVDAGLWLLPWGVGRATSTGLQTAAFQGARRSLRDHVGELPRVLDHPRAFSGPVVPLKEGELPAWLKRLIEGSRWHRAEQLRLDTLRGGNSELYIAKPKRPARGVDPEDWVRPGGWNRLDHYNSERMVIYSMKHTQLAEVREATALRYLDELATKYQPGTPIADVPSTPATLIGSDLDGQMTLLVPEQHAPIPRSVLDYADRLDIVIADPSGRRYS